MAGREPVCDRDCFHCPYCGEQKFGGNDGTTDNET